MMRTDLNSRMHGSGIDRHTARIRAAGAGAALLALLSLGTGTAGAHAATASWAYGATPKRGEYEIKAAFLYRFIEFVDWPEGSIADGPFVIGLLGGNPFGRALETAVRNRRADGHRIVVRRFHDVDAIRHCQVLFVTRDRSEDLDTIRTALGDRPVLTIGEPPEFARAGGMIRLYADGRQVRFEINSGALQSAGLQMSSKLLRLARVIYEPSRPGFR